MEALILFDELKRNPHKLNLCTEIDSPEDLGRALSITDEDVREDLFFIIRDWWGSKEFMCVEF